MKNTINQAIEPKHGQKVAFYARFANLPPDLEMDTRLKPCRAAIYCRTASTHPNDFLTIGIQRDKVRDFALRQGYEVCAEYRDDGFVGNNLDRPAFIQMQADINSGKINTVIVYSINRIARDYFLLEKCLRDFKSQGIKVIAADGSHEFSSAENVIAELVLRKTGMIKSR